MDWIGILEKYSQYLPFISNIDVDELVVKFKNKKDNNWVAIDQLSGLDVDYISNCFYLTCYDEPSENDLKLIPLCKTAQVLDIPTFALGKLKNISEIDDLKVVSIRNIFRRNFDIIKSILVNNDKIICLSLEFSEYFSIEEIEELASINNPYFLKLSYDEIVKIDSKNYASAFNANLGNLIWLSMNLGLSSFEHITKYTNLVHLDLSFNKIKFIPNTINKIPNLRHLNLKRNQISTLPVEVLEIEKLEFISIDNNQITDSPLSILNIPSLEVAYFLNNPYSNFPLINELKRTLNESMFDYINQLDLFKNLLKWKNQPSKNNYNYFTLKIPKVLQTPMMQYITFFKDYVEATKGKDIIFEVKRDKEGLLLVTNGNTGITLTELGEYFQEYVTLIQQDLNKWIPNFNVPKTRIEADIFRLKLQTEVSSLTSKLDIARFEVKSLNKQLADRDGQIDFLKSLSKDLRQDIRFLVQGRTAETLNVDQLLLDIIDQLIKMSERKYSHQLEDLHNDILTDFLRQKNYYVTDQTRSGRSKLSVGELDIMIRKKDGTPFSIIEAFRLKSCGEDNKIVAAHIDKLVHDYDTVGHQRNFIIVYAEAKNFERLWEKYQTYIGELNGKPNFRATYPLISFKEKKEISEKSSIKTGIAKHRRDGEIIEIYHIFTNMFV